MENVKATLQKQNLVFEVEGNIDGITSATLVVNITKVMQASNDVTTYWRMFDDANDFEDAIKKAYSNKKLDEAYAKVAGINVMLDEAKEAIENAKRLLINY